MAIVANPKRNPGRFGARLRAYREAAGYTQDELAKAAGVAKPTLFRYEAGLTEPPWSVVVALAAALGKTPDAFLDDSGG